MITTTNGNSNPMSSFGAFRQTYPSVTNIGKFAYIDSIQIIGFIPLICADEDPDKLAFSKCDCRTWKDDDCYINPVFGDSSGQYDLFKNDKSTFVLEYPFFYGYQWNNDQLSAWFLELWDGEKWVTLQQIDQNNYDVGTYDKLGTLCKTNWTRIIIDWQKVIMQYTEGLYRIKVDNNIFGFGSTYVSELFCLKEWSCKSADKTVRWESTITGGRIGNIGIDGDVFDFCCSNNQVISIYDSIRTYGFFGKEKTEYERLNIEYQNGDVIKIRDEAVQKFEYESALLPKYIHDRFKAYGLMADNLYVSDYNWNNSDYEISRKRVVCDGSYEPEYHQDTRYSKVKVNFKEGTQNVIRDKCCPVRYVET